MHLAIQRVFARHIDVGEIPKKKFIVQFQFQGNSHWQSIALYLPTEDFEIRDADSSSTTFLKIKKMHVKKIHFPPKGNLNSYEEDSSSSVQP